MTQNQAKRTGRRGPRGAVLLKVLVAGGLVAAVGAGAAVAMRDSSGGETAAGSSEIYRVSSSSFDVTCVANGELQARNQTEIRSKLEKGTQIVEIAPEGTFVKKGDLLVRLASDVVERELLEEEDRLRVAQNEMNNAESAYTIQVSDNESALRQAQLKLELATIELQKWREGDLVEQRQQLEIDLESAQREEKRLKKKWEDAQALFEREFVSLDELQQDELAYKRAEANLKQAVLKQQVYEEYTRPKDEMKLTSDVTEAEAEVVRVKTRNESQLRSKESDLAYRRQNLRKREEEVAEIREQLAACTINAPTDGLVVYASSINSDFMWDSRGPMAIGRNISPNETIIVLPDTSEMVAAIKVHESQIGKIKKGQPAFVSIDAAQGSVFEGIVDSIGILAQGGGWRDPNLREYEVKIALTGETGQTGLKPSMRCEAKVILDEVEDVLATPLQAVFVDGAVNYVHVPRGERFEKVPVAIGRRSDTHAELLGGLGAGTPVLLRRPAPGQILDKPFDEKVVGELAALQKPERERVGPGGPGSMERGERAGGPRPQRGAAPVSAAAATATDGSSGATDTPASGEAAAETEPKPAPAESASSAQAPETTPAGGSKKAG